MYILKYLPSLLPVLFPGDHQCHQIFILPVILCVYFYIVFCTLPFSLSDILWNLFQVSTEKVSSFIFTTAIFFCVTVYLFGILLFNRLTIVSCLLLQ